MKRFFHNSSFFLHPLPYDLFHSQNVTLDHYIPDLLALPYSYKPHPEPLGDESQQFP
ncbi:MAG: hypothetical protein AABZ78_03825 [Chloroflexota bacterium]